MTLGFLKAGIPFGAVMSFVIASPLLNPIILTMLAALMGLKAAAVYFVVVFAASIIFGIILEKTGCANLVKNVRLFIYGRKRQFQSEYPSCIKMTKMTKTKMKITPAVARVCLIFK
jgi:uncharacterized membrane protein YraQ (UPF0718 family)